MSEKLFAETVAVCIFIFADMAELADALDSGSSDREIVQVQFLLSAPNSINPNLVLIGDGFGFTVLFNYPNFNSKK